MLQPYIESATPLSDMDINNDHFTPLALHVRGKNMIFCMCAVFSFSALTSLPRNKDFKYQKLKKCCIDKI